MTIYEAAVGAYTAAQDCRGKFQSLPSTGKAKVHVARAMMANPEIAIFQRPTLHFHGADVKMILEVLREHITNRGCGLPPETVNELHRRALLLRRRLKAEKALEASISELKSSRPPFPVLPLRKRLQKVKPGSRKEGMWWRTLLTILFNQLLSCICS